MKKLNRKGFTLVELLAVIIILAIVVGITIPAVLTTTSNAKKKAFATAATSAADWFDRQYQVAKTGIGVGADAAATLDSNFTTLCGETGTLCESGSKELKNATSLISAVGLKADALTAMSVYIDPETGRSCVKLTAVAGGDYSNSKNDSGATLEKTGGSC